MLSDFATWLDKNLQSTKRSKKDVVSRLKRVSNIIDINAVKDNDEAKYLLSKSEVYVSMGKTIQSQLGRSIRLYLQFKKSTQIT